MYGKARTGPDDTENCLAADFKLVAYGVSKDATEEQLKAFISSKGISVTCVTKLTTFESARTNTFKVSIKAADYDKALKPEVWPLRVGVRPFRPKRQQSRTWAEQSASTGGNIQADSQSGQTEQSRSSNHSFGGARSKVPQAPPTPTPFTTSNMFELLGNISENDAVFSSCN